MQLSKLYCNKPNFKNIKFNLNGLNVIYADVKAKFKEKKNSHDIGKTKLAELIDFMMLKEIDKTHFLLKIKRNEQSIFHDYVFFLELLLNSGKYLTVKRTVISNSKISFALNEQSSDGFVVPVKWEHENIPIKKAKELFADYLSLDFFHNKDYDYRKSIGYSLRKQDDFKDVYTLQKFSPGQHIYWKPFMFDLLGFEGKLLRLKYENDLKIETIQSFIEGLKNEFSVKVEDRDEIVADKSIIESEFKETEGKIDKFNFYEQDKKLVQKGIVELEDKINAFNADAYSLRYEIEKTKSSIKNNFSFDIEKVKKVFEETELYFSDQLISDYESLLNFNRLITSERNKLLNSNLKIKEKELSEVNEQLSILNQEREKLLSLLTDSDTFIKFKSYQKELVKTEGKLLKLEEKLSAIDKVIEKEKVIESLHDGIKDTVNSLKNIYQNTDKNQKYSNIRTAFTAYYKEIMDEKAVLSWNINTNNNVDFIPPKVKSKYDDNRDTAKDEGNTYMKLLCVAFDLAILTAYNKESYYRFVYHDDVFSQQDNGIKLRLLKLVKELVKTYKLQYIFSIIKNELPTDNLGKLLTFSDKEIVLKLHDKDSTGTLFGFEF
jgi:uncharacterized protein YydD (DUF2326 family)